MKKVKIGLIGLGDHMLQSHLAFLKCYSDVELVGAYDPNEAAFRRVEDEYNVWLKLYDSVYDLCEAVDAVVIGSPDAYHLSNLVSVIQAKKHVLCEKPLCTTADELSYIRANFKVAQENGLVVTSCHPRRFDPPYVWIKENMAEFGNMFGKLLSVRMDFMYHEPSSEKAGLHGGSLLRDHMNHEIDYVHFLLGISPSVAHKLIDENDRYEVSGIRENDGVSFHFCGTRMLENRHFDETVVLRFAKGEVRVNTKPFALGGAVAVSPDCCGNVCFVNYENQTQYLSDACPFTDYQERFELINRNFIDAIKGVDENYLTQQDLLVNTFFSTAFAEKSTIHFEG